MKKLKLLWRILQTTQADKIMLGFFGFIVLCAFAFQIIEPGFTSFGDGL